MCSYTYTHERNHREVARGIAYSISRRTRRAEVPVTYTYVCIYNMFIYVCVYSSARGAFFFVAVDTRAQISGDQRTRTTVGVCAGSQ